ncbi:MAG TPA: TIGR01777 family oxidoreductase [Mycobacteriales bacterium]|nr:TIGR01777 family oxidoreductase [Mycobacteriales bacterium]
MDPVKIAVTGASGLIGSHLVPVLRAGGHQVLTLSRRAPRQPGEVQWHPEEGRLDAAALAGVDAAVHLAGAGIADKRWSDAYKQTVLRSRIEGTRLLATTLATLDPLPKVLLSGSAIGYYGDAGSRTIDEDAPAGSGFLADVCVAWEKATEPAERAGIRVCHLRTGIVLSNAGGALAKQLPLYKIGLGGPLGSGRQYQSWISLDDEVGAIHFLLTAEGVHGPVNLTAPSPLPQRDFATALGAAVRRPAVLPTPALALRLALGEFADEGLLVGQRVLPAALRKAGYAFLHPTLPEALSAALA